MPSKLYPASEELWKAFTKGMPRKKASAEQIAAAKASMDRVNAGHEFLTTEEYLRMRSQEKP